jgi:dolichol-phosphate mannosyltransferase
VVDSLTAGGIAFELILVNDCSPDDADSVLARLAGQDARVNVVTNTTNQGQHAAISRGIERAVGQWIAVMDCDLQDPPELLPEMLARARAGAPIVIGRRRAHQQRAWRRMATVLFGVLLRVRHHGLGGGSYSVFSVVSRDAAERYLQRHARSVTYLPILADLGMPLASVDYDRAPRTCGESAYSAARLVRHAWDVLRHPR